MWYKVANDEKETMSWGREEMRSSIRTVFGSPDVRHSMGSSSFYTHTHTYTILIDTDFLNEIELKVKGQRHLPAVPSVPSIQLPTHRRCTQRDNDSDLVHGSGEPTVWRWRQPWKRGLGKQTDLCYPGA